MATQNHTSNILPRIKRTTLFGPQTNLFFIARPYMVHNDVFKHCAIMKGPNILLELLVVITVRIVDNGLALNKINNIDAKIPNTDPTSSMDKTNGGATPITVNPKYVHNSKLILTPAIRTYCVCRNNTELVLLL